MKRKKEVKHKVSGRTRLAPLFAPVFLPAIPNTVVVHSAGKKVIKCDISKI
jgi:hypothetical protein